MFECDGQIIFPFAVPRGTWIIGDHRRAALPKCNSRHTPEDERDREPSYDCDTRTEVQYNLPWCENHFLIFFSATSSFSKVGVATLTAIIFPVVASIHTSVRSFLPDCVTSTDQTSTPFTFSSPAHLIVSCLILASAIR